MNLTLFDLDGTLLATDSDHAFGEFLVQRGWADAVQYRRRNDEFFQQYQAGRLDIHAYIEFCTSPWRGRNATDLQRLSADFMDQVVRAALPEASRALVRRHQAAGDVVAIVTATNDFITRPIADLLGVPDLIATELERDTTGRATGAIRGIAAFREGKIARVQQWLAKRGQAWDDFERTTFYSDSTNDLPLLERVSHPVATQPGPELARIAGERGWPILKLFD